MSEVMGEQLPRVHTPAETGFETEVQAEFKRWTGSVAMSGIGSSETVGNTPKINLLERIKAARSGNQEAYKSLAANVDTASFEAVFKNGYVGETYLDRTADGELVQYGQTNNDIHYNAIALRPGRHPVLQDITMAEALNKHRIDAALREGKLKDHYYVAFSLVPNGVPEKELGADGDGYFLDSLTLNIQATTETPNGRVKTETAFMPGVEENPGDSFEDRLRDRHDFRSVDRVYQRFGKEAPGTAPELLRNGLYVPKAMMPHGVPDVMRLFDEAKDGMLGRDIERKPEDYAGLRLESKRREASLKDMRERVLEDLLASDVATPMEAVGRLWELVKVHATTESFTNRNIDPKVFGRAAAPAIMNVRRCLQENDAITAEEFMHIAHEESVVVGCGGGSASPKTRQGGEPAFNMLDLIAGADDKGPLAIVCSNGHVSIRPVGTTIPACQSEDCKAVIAC